MNKLEQHGIHLDILVYVAIWVILIGVISARAEDKPQDKPKPLTAEQTVALYKANDRMTTAMDKVKASKEYVEYTAALDDYNKAVLDAMKGVDQKKWTLGKYYEWVPVK